MKRSLLVLRSLILFGGILSGALVPSWSVAEEFSLAGKKVSVIIGTTPGGGTDISTRLVGRYLSQYLPGRPQMIYRNMPAGGGVQATNYFASEAAKDGSVWMGGGGPYISAVTLQKSVVQYNPTTFNFLGGIARGGSIVMVRKSTLGRLADRSKPPVIVGAAPGMGTWVEMMAWAAEHAGWNLRFVVGYPGIGALVVALRRGEIDAVGTSNLAILRSLEKTGDFAPSLQTGDMQDGKVMPRAGYEQVPVITNLVAGKLGGLAAETFDYWIKADQVDKWYALPPGVPEAAVGAYIAAFRKAAADPAFQKDGRAQFGEGFAVQSAADMTAIVASTSYPGEEKKTAIRDLLVRHGLPGAPLSEAEQAALARKLSPATKVSVTIDGVEREGRIVTFKVGAEAHKVEMSGSRSKVTIAGKTAKRSDIRAGMTCEIAYPGNGGEASSVDCR